MEALQQIRPRFLSDHTWQKCKEFVLENLFIVASVTAFGTGIIIGLIINQITTLSLLQKDLLAFPAEILMQMLQAVILPLIVTSVIIGVAGLSANSVGKLAGRAIIYFVSTTLISVTIGLILVLVMKPGMDEDVGLSSGGSGTEEVVTSYTAQALMDLLRNMMPKNLVQACFQQSKTIFAENDPMNGTQVSTERGYVTETNILGLIVCSFAIGLVLHYMEDEGKLLLDVIVIVNKVTRNVVTWILCYLPVGVLFMIMTNVLDVYDWETTSRLGTFIAVVITGLLIHGVIVLPGLYFLMTRRNPLHVIKGIAPALMCALFISSSSATMPITMRCCSRRLKIDPRISNFMMPIGTSANMDGTALYETVAAVFIANLEGIQLAVSQLLTIALVAGISSLGAPAIPATGAVTTLFVLNSVGLPAQKASILLAVEFLLDRLNTIINVLSDGMGVALVYHLSENELRENQPHDHGTSDAEDEFEDVHPPEEHEEFEDAVIFI